MIRQLLDPQFLLESRAALQEALSAQIAKAEIGDPDTLRKLEEEGLSTDDLREAVLSLAASTTEEMIAKEQPAAAAIPRDATASLLQSSLQSFYEEQKPELLERSAGHGAFASEVPVTDESLIPEAAQVKPQKLFEAMSQSDIRWAAVGFAKLKRLSQGKHSFPDYPAEPLTISNHARVFLVGDWGSGVPRARALAQKIRELLIRNEFYGMDQHVIHLGDVYYSGSKKEYQKNFLDHWPVYLGEETRYRSWCLNGNHDMYAGGHDYFEFLLAEPRFSRQQKSSHFLLENDYWQVFGLDTAWENAGLAGGQAEWISKTRRAAPSKKGMLLSHHQLFSPYEGGSPDLREKLQGYHILEDKLVNSWFWGHEHRCALYEPGDGILYPRLIGHGGVPVWAELKKPPAGVTYQYQEWLASGFEKFARFGFAVLDFCDSKIKVRYINELGVPHKDEVLA
jgi:hypothetical protein